MFFRIFSLLLSASILYALTLDEALQATFVNHPNIKLFLVKLQKSKSSKKRVERKFSSGESCSHWVHIGKI